MKIKPCPFCGGSATIDKGRFTSDYSPCCSYEWYEVECSECGSKSGPVRIKCFADMSDHTVEDFSTTPGLRAKVGRRLDKHLGEKRTEVINNWNKRYK